MLILAAVGVGMLLDGIERIRTNRMRDRQFIAMHGEIAVMCREVAKLRRHLEDKP